MAENEHISGVHAPTGNTGQISVGNATGTYLAVTPHADTALRLSALLDVARTLISERDLDTLLQKILQEASRVVDADRGSLFLVDRVSGELWAKIAQGIGGDREIRIPKGVGIAGHVAATGEIIKLRNAYEDPRFNASVDRATGYQTRALLAVPMVDMHGQIVGVIQVLNKKHGRFTQDDADVLVALGGQAAAAIENAGMQCGMPVGPLAVLDETTLSLSLHVMEQTRADFAAEGRTYVAGPGEALVVEMVRKHGRPGRAGGGGFYEYPKEKGAKKYLWPQLKPIFEKADAAWNITDLKDRLLYRQAVETARCLSEGVLTSVHDANIGSIFGIGFPAWTGGAMQFIYGMGIDTFVKRADELAARFGAGFALSDQVQATIKRFEPVY